MGSARDRPLTQCCSNVGTIFYIWGHDLSRGWASFNVDLPRGRSTLNGVRISRTLAPYCFNVGTLFASWSYQELSGGMWRYMKASGGISRYLEVSGNIYIEISICRYL